MVLASAVLLALLVVSVPVPSAIVPPVPDRAPTVWLRLVVVTSPPSTASAPPLFSALATPSSSVPPVTVVPPL